MMNDAQTGNVEYETNVFYDGFELINGRPTPTAAGTFSMWQRGLMTWSFMTILR